MITTLVSSLPTKDGSNNWMQRTPRLLWLPALSLQDFFPKLCPNQSPIDAAPVVTSTRGGHKTKHSTQQIGKLLMDRELSSQKQNLLERERELRACQASNVGDGEAGKPPPHTWQLAEPLLTREHIGSSGQCWEHTGDISLSRPWLF